VRIHVNDGEGDVRDQQKSYRYLRSLVVDSQKEVRLEGGKLLLSYQQGLDFRPENGGEGPVKTSQHDNCIIDAKTVDGRRINAASC